MTTPSSPATVQLLPCPFCGSPAKESFDEGRNQEWWIICANGSCDIAPMASARDQSRARQWWNTRSVPSESAATGWHRPTLEAVLKGLRSEDDSTQLRAIIASVEAMLDSSAPSADRGRGETPRTDKEEFHIDTSGPYVWAFFARQLEREVAVLIAKYAYVVEKCAKLDAETRLQSANTGGADNYVGWCRYIIESGKPTRIVMCDSDEPGAFKVYRAISSDSGTPEKS